MRPASRYLLGGGLFLVAAIIALFAGGVLVALILALVAAGLFWYATRARTAP